MQEKPLSTEPYKGVRDFYPEDMAVQQYIFDTWSETAESFGFERYDASVLEPAALYKTKGSRNEEMVNDQTYTFRDRGEREVTLRPEMTPTVARMIAKKQKELAFPVRWYSIPNLFRYERPQKGRLREHWQLNCDIFGNDSVAADVEMIMLAYETLKSFGATDDMFEVRLNDRSWMNELFAAEGFTHEQSTAMLYLLDRKDKIDNFEMEAEKIAGKPFDLNLTGPASDSRLGQLLIVLKELGVSNVKVSLSTVRGFDYYTGVIFELFDVSGENNRSLIGGGRYDNLTALFGGDTVSAIGFGMGDVTIRDFLETHKLLPPNLKNKERIVIIPKTAIESVRAATLAQSIRNEKKCIVVVDYNERTIQKRIDAAQKRGAVGYIVVDEKENHELVTFDR